MRTHEEANQVRRRCYEMVKSGYSVRQIAAVFGICKTLAHRYATEGALFKDGTNNENTCR